MKIFVTAKPNSKKESVEQAPDGGYVVRVHTPPVDGQANERVIELLAEHLNIPKSRFQLVSGHRGKRKVFMIS